MTCYAVVDTNVFVSALLSSKEDVATVQVFKRVIRGEIIPIFSSAIMKEYREVLTRKKFGFTERTVEYLLSAVEKYGILVEPAALGIVFSDMKDLPFYEAAVEMRGSGAYLITGNIKHFPKRPFIVTPRGFLDLLA